jgi:hypothetical protein
MTIRPNIYILLGTVFIILTWLLVGLFRDDEFYEPSMFTKYRPTFKVNFYSPIGMQDLELKDLSPDKQIEEKSFQEFIMKQHIQNNSDARLWYLPYILIQLTLTSFCLGILKIRRHLVYKKWQLPTHFAICLILTSFGFGFILSFDNLNLTIILVTLLLAINYFTLILLTSRRKAQTANM